MVVKDVDGNDVIAIRSMCYLSLTYDHRVVDGADAGRFLHTLKTRLEEANFESELYSKTCKDSRKFPCGGALMGNRA